MGRLTDVGSRSIFTEEQVVLEFQTCVDELVQTSGHVPRGRSEVRERRAGSPAKGF